MSMFEELCVIPWPSKFIVEYTDGSRERLLRGVGIHITPPADDPEGIGCLVADLPKTHPRNQTQYGRSVRLSELRAIYSVDGQQLWVKS